MICHYCGTEIPETDVFCRFCGTRQNPAPAPAPAAEPEVPAARDFPDVSAFDEKTFAWQPWQEPQQEEAAPAAAESARPAASAPRIQLPTGRGLAKMFFLGILTIGIYPMVIWSRIVTELNLAASRYDGKRTMPYFGMVMLSPVTLGIYTFVWIHGFCRRIGDELRRRGTGYRFGPKDFWLWNVLGSLILVGPFIFLQKLMKSMNLINADFNING